MAKVWIVDDAKVMRLILSKLFIDLGHDVVAQASDGFEAIHLYDNFKPDMVVMDYEMPHINGLEALIKIKEKYQKANIVMISSCASEENITNAMNAGAKGFIQKPINATKAKTICSLIAK